MRVECDSFGEVEIPEDKLYGIQTIRAIQNLAFSEKSLSQYPLLIKSFAKVKKAAALTNMATGSLDISLGSAIVKACEELIAECHTDHFPIDVLHGGGGIAANMNVNEVIANLANETAGANRGVFFPVHPIDHVNASQSTSDVCHTAMRLAIIDSFKMLDAALEEVQASLDTLVIKFKDITTISRTCLQDAMKVQLGDTFSGYASVLSRRRRGLKNSVSALKTINLGGTVIGSGTGASQAYREQVIATLSKVCNLDLHRRENLYDAAQNIDDLADVSKQLALLATSMIKVAKDLRLLSSGPEAGFSEIALPAVMAGSSFFPGKVNPVIPETLIQSCFQVLGCDRVVQAASEHGELDLNSFEGVAGVNVLDGIHMLGKSLTLFSEKCLDGVTANKEKCEQYATSFIPLVVELKEKYGYSTISNLIKEKGEDGVKKLFKSGGFEIEID